MELADHRRQDPQRGGRQRADAHDIVIQPLFTVQRLARRVKGIKHFHGMSQKLFPDQRQLRPQTSPLKQTGTGQLFKLVKRF